MRRNSYKPNGVIIAVLGISTSATGLDDILGSNQFSRKSLLPPVGPRSLGCEE